jgi:triosephosphate isomerase
MSRRLLLAGNWKMNLVGESTQRLIGTLVNLVGTVQEVDIVVCPPFPYLLQAQQTLVGTRIVLGAQNMHFESSGAFTGEVSAAMLLDCGCNYVILGHSERRHVFGESDESINRKVRAAVAAGLRPILCVGELLAEREAGRTTDVVGAQLRNGLLGVRPEQLRQVDVAYEPVWAIGTGKVATPEQAAEVHRFARDSLTKLYGADLGQAVRILYGGSVKADNADGLLGQPNVDGLLVGGASLKADEFAQIIQAGVRRTAAAS